MLRADFLAAWAGSEHNITIHDLWTRDLNQSNVYGCFPRLNATCGNNITTRNLMMLKAGAEWPTAAQAVIDGAGARIKTDEKIPHVSIAESAADAKRQLSAVAIHVHEANPRYFNFRGKVTVSSQH